MPRPALSEVTNLPDPQSSIPSYFLPKGQGQENKRGTKRPREPRSSDADYDWALRSPMKGEGEGEVVVDVDRVKEPVESVMPPRCRERKRTPGWPGVISSLRLGERVLPQQIPTHNHLLTLHSSHLTDTLRFPSFLPQRECAVPFALAFTRGSARGAGLRLATATEEGSVMIVNAEKRRRFDPMPEYHTLQPHQNAIFALSFSLDDTLLATASGDRTCVLTDVRSGLSIARLEGHSGSVRRVVWDPNNPHLLSTAARDGAIRCWDTRLAAGEQCTLGIVDAHEPAQGSTRGRGAKSTGKGTGTGKGRARGKKMGGKTSVTGLVYAPGREGALISAGSADGVLKLWDVRSPKSPAETSYDPTVLSPLSAPPGAHTARSRGIISLTLSGPSSLLIALGAGSRLHAYNAHAISTPPPAHIAAGLTHPNFRAGSFYVDVAASPGGRYVAAGSSVGSAFVWDLMAGSGSGSGSARPLTASVVNPKTRSRGVELKGHSPGKECASVAWVDEDTLATAGDDGVVRVWRGGPGEMHGEKEAWAGVWAE